MKGESEFGPGGASGGPGGGKSSDHDQDTVTVVVNGKARQVPKNGTLTFWDVVKLAFENPQTGDSIQYTVQYTRGEGNKPAGAVVQGQSVKAKDGMEFDVTSTNRS